MAKDATHMNIEEMSHNYLNITRHRDEPRGSVLRGSVKECLITTLQLMFDSDAIEVTRVF